MTSKAVRRKYNFLAWAYDRIYRNYIRKTNECAIQALSLKGGESLLNIGCGTGELERRLLQKHPKLHCVGVDLSSDMLKRAKEKLAGYTRVEFKEGDFLRVALPENSFDVVFSISNFHYFSNPEGVLAKARRLLKKHGQFILIDWNRKSLKGRIYQTLHLFDPAFVKVYTIAEARDLLAANGFSVEKGDRFRVGLLWQMMRLVARKI